MIIHVKQSFEIRNKDGEKFVARNGDIVTPPSWVAENKYFQLLCDSGKITAHVDTRSAEFEQLKESKPSNEKQVESKRAKGAELKQ